MDNIIALIIVFAFGWFIGSKVTTHLLALSFRQILNDLGVTNDQLRGLIDVPAEEPAADALSTLEITLEQHQGVIYAYRKDNNQFLGQGVDQQGLIDSISKRMTDVRLIIREADGADLLQKSHS